MAFTWCILLTLLSTPFSMLRTMRRSEEEADPTYEKAWNTPPPGYMWHGDISEEGCNCWNTTDYGGELEVECRCVGGELGTVPEDLYPGVQRLTIADAGIEVLEADSFKPYRDSLRDIVLMKMRLLREIKGGTFSYMPLLRAIYISQAPQLKILPADLFQGVSNNMKTLRFVHTGLEDGPYLVTLEEVRIMQMIELDNNRIKSIRSYSIKVNAEALLLNYNDIRAVQSNAFSGSQIAKLSLKGNRMLTELSLDAFSGLRSLRTLDLSETSITQLPTKGLEDLEVLKIQNTVSLKVIPSIYSFQHLREAWLTYSFHCCAFKFPARHNPSEHAKRQIYLAKIREQCSEVDQAKTVNPLVKQRPQRHARWNKQVQFIHRTEERKNKPMQYIGGFALYPLARIQPTSFNSSDTQTATIGPSYDDHDPYKHDHEKSFGAPISEERNWGRLNPGKIQTITEPTHDEIFHTAVLPPTSFHALCGNLSRSFTDVECHPVPDAFNPCEDIMGTIWLRVAVWFVVVNAVLGNLAVILVLASGLFHMTVPKFLMCNLAFADLCMGTYLLIIAAMDLHSIGEYFNFAFDWQIGPGCQVAGFITVFASQLSIFTLGVLTLERWFAITHAIYLNKRLRLNVAVKIMAVGWGYSVSMATLPLLGISGYSTTSICLPMETRKFADVAYLTTLLVMNGLAFVVICVCYFQIYSSLDRDTRSGSATAASGEMTVAKKMALLVFTDFACWAPIAFFGLTAVAGYPLIDVTHSKILLVFFYPLNSCANPYLYAILTTQYRRDLFVLLSRYGLFVRTAAQYKGTCSVQNVGTGSTTVPNSHPLFTRNALQRSKGDAYADEDKNFGSAEVFL